MNTVWMHLLGRRHAPPHALLVSGPAGLGKQELAIGFAKAMLCRTPEPDGAACGRCEACHWFTQDSHPDFRLVAPEADEPAEEGRAARPSKMIRIHQVRALQDWLAVGAHQSGWRVAVIAPAEAMNPSTANALLKTLEEPPPLTLLLLVSHHPSRLLPTLRSRCQQVVCPIPPGELAEAWLRDQGIADPAAALALSSGSPLTARDASSQEEMSRAFLTAVGSEPFDLFNAAARLAAFPMGGILDLLQKWIYDARCAGLDLPIRYYRPYSTLVSRTAGKVHPSGWLGLERRLVEARRLAEHPLNARLVLEDLFAAYAEVLNQP
jgi:DNA polymerase III subunit delta'